MAKPKGLPELLNVGGRMYQLTVFRVASKYEDGTPEECVLLPNDMTVELAHGGGDEFMACYVPRVMFKGQ